MKALVTFFRIRLKHSFLAISFLASGLNIIAKIVLFPVAVLVWVVLFVVAFFFKTSFFTDEL